MAWQPHMWGLSRAPYAVQSEAMTRSHGKRKFGFFLEQGLGKSAVDFAKFMEELDSGVVDAHIIVAPNYLKSGWRAEAADTGFPYPIITWPKVVTLEQAKKPHVFVTNSEGMLSSGGAYLEELLQSKDRRYSVTLDESSFIKNYSGKVSKTTRQICYHATTKRQLCGTPATQSVMDWYPQLRFLGEVEGWNPIQFRNHFAKMGGFMGKKVTGYYNEPELHEILNRCSFRAMKKDWWDDMPEKIYNPPLEFEMTKKQAKAYDVMLNDFYYEVAEDDGVFANQVIHMKLKLQQISRGFIIDRDNDRILETVPLKDNQAVKVTKQWVENTPGKVLIAVHFKPSLALMEEAFKDDGFLVMRGGMDEDEMGALKAQFNGDRTIKGMIGMDAVMARGHTLLGTEDMRCSNTLFFENSYNLETRSQLEDRNHRFGQDRAVGYYDLFCGQEDRNVVLALQQKQDMVEAIVNAVRATRH